MVNENPPLAVVLEGTLGKAWNYGERWQKYQQRLNPVLKADANISALMQGNAGIRGIKDGNLWLSYIFEAVREAPVNDFSAIMQGLSSGNLHWHTQHFLQSIQNASTQLTGTGQDLSFGNVVGCRELQDLRDMLGFRDNLLIVKDAPANDDPCANLPFNRKYNAANYQIASPIYYLQGREDPATPMFQMQYHFSSQVHSKSKNWVVLDDRSHNIFGIASDWHCVKKLWRNIAKLQSVRFAGSAQRFCNP